MAFKKSKFQKWVEKKGGSSELARALGIPRPTVYMWYSRQRTPLPDNLKQLKDFANGELSYEDILEGTAKQ